MAISAAEDHNSNAAGLTPEPEGMAELRGLQQARQQQQKGGVRFKARAEVQNGLAKVESWKSLPMPQYHMCTQTLSERPCMMTYG